MLRVVSATVATATTDLARRVADEADGLAPAERRFAIWLLDAGPDASLLSAAAMAEVVGISDATVVRAAKALGYSGLAELRRALTAHGREPALTERLQRTLEQSSQDDLFSAVIKNHTTAVDALVRHVSPRQFDRAVAHLARARRIVWRGVGPSAHLAEYGEVLTRRMGKQAIAMTQTGTSFADELLALDTGDAVVLLAYGQPQPHVGVLLRRASTLHAAVVLVTDDAANSPRPARGTTLLSGRGVAGQFASHGTTLVMVEALVLGLAATQRPQADDTLDTLNDLRAALAGRRLDVDTRQRRSKGSDG
jgi:DNA-binding MurR/RpiR family transcriptional regulator